MFAIHSVGSETQSQLKVSENDTEQWRKQCSGWQISHGLPVGAETTLFKLNIDRCLQIFGKAAVAV